MGPLLVCNINTVNINAVFFNTFSLTYSHIASLPSFYYAYNLFLIVNYFISVHNGVKVYIGSCFFPLS